MLTPFRKQIGIATAIVYFHRFYARHTPDKWDAFVSSSVPFSHRLLTSTNVVILHKILNVNEQIVATTCLFLAGKVVDTPVKLERVIRIGYKTYRGKEVERLEVISSKEAT